MIPFNIPLNLFLYLTAHFPSFFFFPPLPQQSAARLLCNEKCACVALLSTLNVHVKSFFTLEVTQRLMQRDSYEGRKSFAEQFMILTFYTYENSYLLNKKSK